VRRAAPVGLLLGLLAVTAIAAIALFGGSPVTPGRVTAAGASSPATPGTTLDLGTAPSPLSVRLEDPRDTIRIRFKHPPRAALVFDVDTGQVLWRRHPTRTMPIASLTKMMTGLVATDRIPEGGKVRITRKALHYQGSGVGLLPRGKRIGISTMLYGLLLPSGNDAARAIAERAGGTIRQFVAMMNARASAMGLTCSRFSSPDGFEDRGNHSCAADLAAIGRAVLREPRLARVVARESVVLPFPIKARRLYLYNHNPLLRMGYRGTTGIKTGYTDAAGRCLVATARRGAVRLGVVLLHSPDPATQARQLLDRGFKLALARR
jgi:D-alanyl-D-alanine carboxypeptidase